MTETLAFDHLVKRLHRQLAALPDYRTGEEYPVRDQRCGAGCLCCLLYPVALLFGLSADDATG